MTRKIAERKWVFRESGSAEKMDQLRKRTESGPGGNREVV